MSLIRSLIVLFLVFSVTFILTIVFYFEDIKSDAVEKFMSQNKLSIHFLKEKVNEAALINDFKTIDSTIETIVNTKTFKLIELRYKEYIFSRDALFLNSNNVRDNRWKISDVTTNAIYGEIRPLEDNLYKLMPTLRYDNKKPIEIKFQAMADRDAQNSISKLRFYSFAQKKDDKDKKYNSDSWLNYFVDISMFEKRDSIEIQKTGRKLIKITYELDPQEMLFQIENVMKKLLIYSVVLFILVFIALNFFHKKVVRHDILIPLEILNSYSDEILNGRFVKAQENKFKLKEISQIYESLKMLSKKFAGVSNELNITRQMMQRRELTDELTKMPNKKVFENDVKSMFVTNKSGYIVLAKIYNLGEFTNQHGSNEANHLIEDFAQNINNISKKKEFSNFKIYRFYGAEFAMIILEENIEIIKKYMERVVQASRPLEDKYHTGGDIAHFGITPFDRYGTIDSILYNAFEAYKNASQSKGHLYYISENSELIEKTKRLEDNVKDIIERSDFALRYVYDTLTFDTNPALVMQEVSPVIIDMDTFEKMAIGTFVSVAEKLRLAGEFDKILIKKVIEQQEFLDTEHKVAINLSVKSFSDRKFISWLEGTLLYSEKVKDVLVFSVTSYTAAQNLAQFRKLVDTLHRYDSKILLKRFKLDDFNLDELKELNIDYLRVHKDYCNNINDDKRKKHMLKNIVLFADMNDIKVLGDSVKSEDDYHILDRLGMYATSR
jgi:EAL domain-containing protein (putative c-di-GMP-specific phosphodiesterase class I)/GGDEF domain-containing protein